MAVKHIAILGTGNIGTDLLIKVLRSNNLKCEAFVGRNLQSNSAHSYALIMMMTGLGLKALFIVLFIRQIRMVRNQNTI